MQLLRKIFFYFLIVIYIIFCPLTILYSLGYIFRPGSEKGLVKTGLIYISTAPPGASIFMGDKRYKRKTPAILRDLLPGQYPIKISMKDHKVWFENVPVEAEKATTLERILLLPEEWKYEELLPDSFEDLTPIEETRFFLLTRGSKIENFFIYDWKDEKVWPIVPAHSPFRDGTVVSRFMVQGSPFFLLRVHVKEGEKYLWVESKGKDILVEDFTRFFPVAPFQVEWDPRDKNHLFAFRENYINQIDLVSKSVYPRFLENVRGCGFFHKWIYVLKQDHTFQQMDHEGKVREVLLKDAALAGSLFGGKGFFQIRVLSKDTILFLGEKGELLASRLPYRFIEEGILGLKFLPQSERLLIWKRNQLGILDFSKPPKEEEIFEKGPRLSWIYKRGERIEQAFWAYEGTHILFRDGDKIYLLELETYAKPHLHYILEVKKKSSVFYSEASGKLYYLDHSSGRLCSVKILPREEILLFPFPERKEEKKKSEIQEL